MAAVGLAGPQRLATDESVFVKGLEAGERETILYIWTRDADGRQSDFLTVVDVDPASETYEKIVSTAPTGAWLLHVGPYGVRVDEDFAPDFNRFPSGPAGPHDMLLK